MSPTKLSLPGSKLIIPGQGEFGFMTSRLGDGKIANLFLQFMFPYNGIVDNSLVI
jgi:hypothetical protein